MRPTIEWWISKPWRVGLTIGVCLEVAMILLTLGMTARGYRGTCGGFIPFLSAPQPCSFRQYFVEQMSLTWILFLVHWWVPASILAIPALVGLLWERLQ